MAVGTDRIIAKREHDRHGEIVNEPPASIDS
jgi:hypothetical protein